MKKKLIMVLIAMGMVCSLPACGVSENGKGTEKTSILKKDDFGVTLGEFSRKATIEEKVLYDKVLFCKLNDAPFVTLNDAVPV